MTPHDNRYLIVVNKDGKDVPYNLVCEHTDEYNAFDDALAGLQYFDGIVYPINDNGVVTGEPLIEERVENPYPSPGDVQQTDADANTIW